MSTSLVDGLKPLIAALGVDYKNLIARDGDLTALQTTAKGNLVAAINEVLAKEGDLTTLTTTAKGNLVAALNEVRAVAVAAAGGGVAINDAATNGATTVTWSADKIFDELVAMRASLKSEILGGSAAALDTLQELATALGNDAAFSTTIANGLAVRPRFDGAQALTDAQKTQFGANIGMGEPNTDFVALYVAAKA